MLYARQTEQIFSFITFGSVKVKWPIRSVHEPHERKYILCNIFSPSLWKKTYFLSHLPQLCFFPGPLTRDRVRSLKSAAALVGFYRTNHAPISKAELHITVTIMRVNRKLWVFIKITYAPLRMRNSHETVSPFPSTRLFCKCDQAECGPRGADAIKGIPVTHHPTTTLGS